MEVPEGNRSTGGFRTRSSIDSTPGGFPRFESNAEPNADDTPSPKSGLHDDGGLSNSNSPGGVGQSKRGKNGGKRKDLNITKKKTSKDPHPGVQPSIKNVFDILKQTRIIIGMIQNVWGTTNHTTTYYRHGLPGLCRVHVGNDVYILQGYLLQDMAGICSGFAAKQSRTTSLSHTTITDPTVHEVHVRYHSTYFPYVILLLKLRWVVRLHSAACELDYKQCSLKNLILGLQTVVLQHCAEAEADSGFDSKVVQHIGSHINLESVLDDITDQLQRALGKSWRGFLEFVATCDPTRSVYGSQMDRGRAPLVVSNESLAAVIDSIFIADFLRQPRMQSSGKLRELYDDLEMLGIPAPELPALRGAANLRAWAIAKTKPTRKDREKGGGKHMEKLAQQDFVALTCALELHDPEVMASTEEIEESTSSVVPLGMAPADATPQIHDLGIEGDKPASAGPPAARIILEEKPRITSHIIEGAVAALQHHITFPDGIRERLFKILYEEYGLTQEQSERVGIATSQNIDGHRLAEHTLRQMDAREKVRIRDYSAYTNKECSHLLVAPLVPAPCHKGKPAHYTLPPPVPFRPGLPGSAFGSVDMTKSLPDLRGFAALRSGGRSEFKVPLSTGPLTMDPDLNRLRTTGLFIRMPPLKFS